METSVLTVIIILCILWLGALSFVVFRMVSHYNKLLAGTTDRTLREVLEGLLQKQHVATKDIESLRKACDALAADGELHFQRLGLVRYNPFSDTGGSQSFSLALLDGKDNGLVMTSLYARTGNRWYIKHVKNGSGLDVELSKEEETAIKKARAVS